MCINIINALYEWSDDIRCEKYSYILFLPLCDVWKRALSNSENLSRSEHTNNGLGPNVIGLSNYCLDTNARRQVFLPENTQEEFKTWIHF